MLKKLLILLLWATPCLAQRNVIDFYTWAAGQTTHTFPALDTANTFTQPGTYTAAQTSQPFQFILNSCNPKTASQGFQSFPVYNVDALVGCNLIPSSAAVTNGNGVAGYAGNNSTAVGAAGGFFEGVDLANTTQSWGVLADCNDIPGLTGAQCTGLEDDINIYSASTQGQAFLASGIFSAQPASMLVLEVLKPVGGQWTGGINFTTGSLSGNAMTLNPQAAGNGQFSQQIGYNATNSLGATLSALTVLDSSGFFNIIAPGNVHFLFSSTGTFSLPGSSSGSSALAAPATGGQTHTFPSTAAANGSLTPIILQGNPTSQKSETGTADANVLTVTPPSLAGNYRVCFTASVSSATAGVIGWTLSWTDSNGNAQSNIAQSFVQQGTAAPALTFTTSAAGNYQSCSQIDVNNAGANIVVKWVGGGTTAAKVSATIERLI